MTGFEFGEYFKSITDDAFSDWFPDAQLNILAKAALYKSIEYKVATNDRQQVHDDLFSLISIADGIGSNTFPMTDNRVQLQSVLTNYLHIYAVQPMFSVALTNKIVSVKSATPIIITLDYYSPLRGRSGGNPSLINITGITGTTNANGISYVKQVSSKEYALYNDVNLTIPKTGNGEYTGGGSIEVLHNNWAQIISSNERPSSLSSPTINNPRYTIADGTLCILPFDKLCQMVRVDYVKKPTVFIDFTDNIIDLEQYYTQRFLYFIADKLAEICKQSQKDYEMAAAATQQLQTP